MVRDADKPYVEQAITQHGFLVWCIMHACFGVCYSYRYIEGMVISIYY